MDTPCNEMNTDHFLDVSQNGSDSGNIVGIIKERLYQLDSFMLAPSQTLLLPVSGNQGCGY